LVAPLSRVSRQHACIIRDGRGYAIRDLACRNGAFINGKPIGADLQPLKDGDQIGLGGTIALRFHDVSAIAAAEQLDSRSGVWVDESVQEAWVDGRRIEPPLSPAQLALLALLHRAAGQAVARPPAFSGRFGGPGRPLGVPPRIYLCGPLAAAPKGHPAAASGPQKEISGRRRVPFGCGRPAAATPLLTAKLIAAKRNLVIVSPCLALTRAVCYNPCVPRQPRI
jgi:predicted component of type VI protein secretion system